MIITTTTTNQEIDLMVWLSEIHLYDDDCHHRPPLTIPTHLLVHDKNEDNDQSHHLPHHLSRHNPPDDQPNDNDDDNEDIDNPENDNDDAMEQKGRESSS